MADVDSINPAVYFSPPIVDVVIIGGGLSGTLAAVVLARGGLQITLTDLHHVYPQTSELNNWSALKWRCCSDSMCLIFSFTTRSGLNGL